MLPASAFLTTPLPVYSSPDPRVSDKMADLPWFPCWNSPRSTCTYDGGRPVVFLWAPNQQVQTDSSSDTANLE